jgi:hypothetical protein
MERPFAGPGMRGRVETIHEPGVTAHRCGDSEREILRELEGLEVVQDHRLRQAAAEVMKRQ